MIPIKHIYKIYLILIIINSSLFGYIGMSTTVTFDGGPEYWVSSKNDTLVFTAGIDATMWLNDTVPAKRYTKGYGIGFNKSLNTFRLHVESKRILFWLQNKNPLMFLTSGFQYGPVISINTSNYRKSNVGVQAASWIYFGPLLGLKVISRINTSMEVQLGFHLSTGIGGHSIVCSHKEEMNE